MNAINSKNQHTYIYVPKYLYNMNKYISTIYTFKFTPAHSKIYGTNYQNKIFN